MLIACNPTPEQKEKAFNTYGKEKAFNKTSGGTVIHLADGTKTYYIPSSVSGDYKTISEYAAAKANTLTSAITINTSTTDSSSSFFFSVAPYSNPDNTNANATNWYSYSTSTGVLSKSEIRYSSNNLGPKNLQYKKHTALHEMGHTFGLGHVNESILNGYTVMLSPHPDSKYELDDYGEFDRANIEWQYGKVVIIDYLQILAPYSERATDKQNTDKAVMELKRISRDYKTPVICISSFNRANYKEAVTMEAFKESGAIEYSSDVLIGLQLKGAGEKNFDANEAKRKDPREIELVILKNRNGRTGGKISFNYYPLFNYFREA